MAKEPEIIDMEENEEGGWQAKQPEGKAEDSKETSKEGANSNPKNMSNMKKGAEVVDKVAKQVEKTGMGVETLASLAYSLRSKRLQGIWDWFSEDTQRELLRADDRTFIMKFVEKWMPQLDWRTYNYPKENLKAILIVLASMGVVDVKPEILKDMRGIKGTGILSLPDPVISIGLELLGIPEAIPLIKAAKSLGKAGEATAERVRAAVQEKVETNKVEEVEKEEHDKEVHAAGMDKEKKAA